VLAYTGRLRRGPSVGCQVNAEQTAALAAMVDSVGVRGVLEALAKHCVQRAEQWDITADQIAAMMVRLPVREVRPCRPS
jgi:hypothetical protein